MSHQHTIINIATSYIPRHANAPAGRNMPPLPPGPTSTPQDDDSATQHKTILVVDDDPSILTTIADILLFEGYHVETATNGMEALAAIEKHQPGLVLLDMRMPVLDGWGFAQALKEHGIKLPILVMTAAQDAKRWADEINAAGYLAKPFDLLELLKAVERIQVTD